MMLQNLFTGLNLLLDRSVGCTLIFCRDSAPIRPFSPFGKNLIWTDVPREEGWSRHQEKCCEASFDRGPGVVDFEPCFAMHSGKCGGSDHPVCACFGRFGAFDYWRSHLSSRGGGFAQQSFSPRMARIQRMNRKEAPDFSL